MASYDFANQLVTSKDFFDRSTRLLEESDSGFRPRDGMMTVAQQVAHTAQTVEWFVEGAARPEGFDLDFEKHVQVVTAVTSLAQAREWLDAAYANAIEYVRSLSPEELDRPLAGPVLAGEPVSAIVAAAVEHSAHHRGALAVYQRLLGKVPPMPYGG